MTPPDSTPTDLPPPEPTPPTPRRRVTIAKLARTLGLATSTVSMALRGDHRVALKTQRAVRAAAQEAGYRHDPEVSRLMRQLRGTAGPRARTTIGVAVDDPAINATDAGREIRRGLIARFNALGYEIILEPYPCSPSQTPTFERRLRAANTEGLVLCPSTRGGIRNLGLANRPALRKLALLGLNIADAPGVDIVKIAWYRSALHTLDLVRNHGHRRIAIAFCDAVDAATDSALSIAITYWSSVHPGLVAGPPHLLPLPTVEELNQGALRSENRQPYRDDALVTWYRAARPDALVVAMEEYARPVVRALRHAGIDQVRCYVIGCHPDSELPGSVHDYYNAGLHAADWMISKIHRDHRGLNPATLRVLVQPGTLRT